jgi:regulator of extracellular matrix RemA (YlzA/DUF370 family)
MGRRRQSTTAPIVAPSAASGSASSRKWGPPARFRTSFRSTRARRTVRRPAQKGGVRRSDRPLARAEERAKFGHDRGGPAAFALTPGNIVDVSMAVALLGAVATPRRLLADKAYDADSLRDWLKGRKIRAVVRQPPQDGRLSTPEPTSAETSSNGMFCKLKDRRRIATRYDRRAQNHLAALALADIQHAADLTEPGMGKFASNVHLLHQKR